MGFVMRFDSYPPAVAVPPMVTPQHAPTAFNGSVIDVQAIKPSAPAASSPGLRHDMKGGFAYMGSGQEQPLTYNHRGKNDANAITAIGRAVDLYV